MAGLALILLLVTASWAQGAPDLAWRHPSPAPGHLMAVTYGGDRFVAVGYNGTVLTSVDGAEWLQAVVDPLLDLNSVAYGNGRYVAAGAGSSGGAVLVSVDGRSWTRQADLPAPTVVTVAFAGGLFGIATADDQGRTLFYTSADGTAWAPANPPVPGRWAAMSRLVADDAAFYYPEGTRVWRSTDMRSWTEAGQLPERSYLGPYAGGRFFSFGIDGVSSSADLQNWRQEGRWMTGVWGVARGPDRFVVAATHGALTLPDAGEAVSAKLPGQISNLVGADYGSGTFVVVGMKGYLASSADGLTWTKRAPGSRAHMAGLAAGNGRFVAVGAIPDREEGGGAALMSTDGMRWRTVLPDVKGWLTDVAFGAGRFVAVGSSGEIWSSADGAEWSEHAVPADFAPSFTAVLFDGARFLAFSRDGIFASANGQQWAPWSANLPEETYHRVIRAGGQYVAVGTKSVSGKLQALVTTSPDGVTWTDRSPGLEGRLTGVAYGDGLFVAVGTELVLSSTDGITWAPDERFAWSEWVDVAHAAGRFFGLTAAGVYDLDNLAAEAQDLTAGMTPWGGMRLLAAGNVLVAAGRDGQVASGVVWSAKEGPGPMEDVPDSHPAAEAIGELMARAVVTGKGPGTFDPEGKLTRAEAATLLARALSWEMRPGQPLLFRDTAGHWAAQSGTLQAAVEHGAIGGYPDGTFRPNDPVTRAQLAKMAAAAVGLQAGGSPPFGDIAAADWFAGWVAAGQEARLLGLMARHPIWYGAVFEGDLPATRAEAAMVIANMMGLR